jgi:hypothetical protein
MDGRGYCITTDFSEPLPVSDVFKITPNAVNAEAVLKIILRYPMD